MIESSQDKKAIPNTLLYSKLQDATIKCQKSTTKVQRKSPVLDQYHSSKPSLIIMSKIKDNIARDSTPAPEGYKEPNKISNKQL